PSIEVCSVHDIGMNDDRIGYSGEHTRNGRRIAKKATDGCANTCWNDQSDVYSIWLRPTHSSALGCWGHTRKGASATKDCDLKGNATCGAFHQSPTQYYSSVITRRRQMGACNIKGRLPRVDR